jgi:hypothetical protein
MHWFNDDGIIPFDVSAGQNKAEWFRFLSAPGTAAITIHAKGKVEAWINGTPMAAGSQGRFTASSVPPRAAIVALRIEPEKPGITGGALIPDPVVVETNGSGVMETGDWSKNGILLNYSGGVRYTTTISLEPRDARSKAFLNLGSVAGTAGISVNGKEAGVRVAPPWKQEITGLLKKGDNKVEITVYNTLSNHYQTIPSHYRGNPLSGLLGPVKLELCR